MGGAETEQGLKDGHGLSAAIVTQDELVEVDRKLRAANAVIGTDQSLLEVADRPVG